MTTAGLRVCSQCTHLNPPDARFCNQCGKSIAQSGHEPEHYTPRHLSEKILRMRSALEGERKQVTVLFADIKGSVAMSRQVEAERWHQIMDRFFGILSECVHDYEGTINQYTGDGVMALFGAPIAHEDHAMRACRAALAIREKLLALAADLKRQHGLDFAARMGLNSGEVVVGRIGDDLRMDYTAQGQTVGLAARMEQLAAGNSILISRNTYDLVEYAFAVRERSSVSIKGYGEKVRSYELSGVAEVGARERDAYPLVGRERELNLLEAYRQRARDKARGLMVTISAETGLGKSRLCHEFVDQCRAQGVPTYSISGSSHHRVEPEEPLRAFLREFLGLAPLSDDDPVANRNMLEQVLRPYQPIPESMQQTLLHILGLLPDSTTVDDNQRHLEQTLELILRLLHDGALREHAVIVIENVHWLDNARTHDFFDTVFSMVPHIPVLIVITARPDYVVRWADKPYVRNMLLRPLSMADSIAFLSQILGAGDELEELKLEIAMRADGNPMFMSELIRQLTNTGVLSRDSRGFRLKRAPRGITLPPSVQAVVAARVDALPENCKRLVQIAAVVGRRVPLQLLRDVYAVADFDAALRELMEQGFVYRDAGPEARAALLFTQSLFQTVTHDALLSEQRREINRRIAEVIQREPVVGSGMCVHLARHLAAAGEGRQAAHWYMHAAQRSSRSDLPEAVRRLDLALKALESAAATTELRSFKLLVLARRLQYGVRLSADGEDLEALVTRAEALIDQGVDDASQAMFRIARGTWQLGRGDADKGLKSYRQAMELAAKTHDQSLVLAAQVPLVHGLQISGQLEEALLQVDTALALAEQLDKQQDGEPVDRWLGYSPTHSLIVLKVWIKLWLGRVSGARDLLRDALARAQQDKHGEQVVFALAATAYIQIESGELEAGLNSAEQAVGMAVNMENGAAELMALMALGRGQLRSMRWAEAVSDLEDALARVGQQSFGLGEAARLEMDLSLAYLGAGDNRKAREAAARAVERAERSGARLIKAEAQLAQVRAGLYSSRPFSFLKRYRSVLDQLRGVVQDCHARLLMPELLWLHARWLRLRDEHQQAEELERQVRTLVSDMGLEMPPVSTLI